LPKANLWLKERDLALTCPGQRPTMPFHRCGSPQMSDYSYCHMALKMETHISDNVLILHCTGRLVFGDEAAAFRERIKNILLGTNQIVVNLSGIEYIDSGGLGTLVGTLASTRNRHGEIKLVRPMQRVSDLLQRTRLHTVFKSYESDDEAVAAFRDHS
jgi:anti-sigma B factor antagonist